MQPLKMVLIVVAVAAIGVGIYANVGKVNNTGNGQNASADSCQTTPELAKSLEPLATGELAAFQVATKSNNIGDQTFKDADGNDKTLRDWRGKVVLLNLWATWCAPCRREMPALEALQIEQGGADFQVIPVSVDLGEPEKAKKFYSEIGLKALPFMADGTMAIFNNLKKSGLAFGMPSTLLVDKHSCVLGVLNGPAEWASQDAINLIKAARQISDPVS